MKFAEINIVDALVITGLIIGLVMAIFYQMENVIIGIVGALAGYLGSQKNHKEIDKK